MEAEAMEVDGMDLDLTIDPETTAAMAEEAAAEVDEPMRVVSR